MDLQLAGKTAVVTGASKGIGLAVTTALVNEGVKVIAGSRSLSAGLEALGDAQKWPTSSSSSRAAEPATSPALTSASVGA